MLACSPMNRFQTTLVSFSISSLLACTAGCSGDDPVDTPDAGPDASTTVPTYAAVQAIFDAHCVSCHDATKLGLPSYPSLSLVAADSYAALVGKPADQTCGGTRVVAGAPDASYLMAKLGASDPCSGEHMPRPFEIGPRLDLSGDEMETVRGWIAAGAKP